MLLTTADGTRVECASRAELEGALATLGDDGNEYAALKRSDQVYIQASGTGRDRFVAEYREGSDEAHFSSNRANLSRVEVIGLFGSYLDGTGAWKSSVEWERMDPTAPEPRGRRGTAKRAVRPRGDAIATVVVLFGVVGSVLIALGLRDARNSRAFLSRAESTGGMIVAYTHSDGRHTGSFPIVKFQTRDGRVWSFHGRVVSSPTAYRTGDKVAVLYDPAHPDEAMIDDDTSLWHGAIGLTAFGSMFAAVAGYALLRRVFWRRRLAGSSPLRR